MSPSLGMLDGRSEHWLGISPFTLGITCFCIVFMQNMRNHIAWVSPMPLLTPVQIALLDTLRHLVSIKEIRQLEISLATGVHQSQISRILSGSVQRSSKNVQKLCSYAESVTSALAPPNLKTRLASAIAKLAADSPEGLLALENLIVGLERWRNSWRGTA